MPVDSAAKKRAKFVQIRRMSNNLPKQICCIFQSMIPKVAYFSMYSVVVPLFLQLVPLIVLIFSVLHFISSFRTHQGASSPKLLTMLRCVPRCGVRILKYEEKCPRWADDERKWGPCVA